jgi:hypothetical protein
MGRLSESSTIQGLEAFSTAGTHVLSPARNRALSTRWPVEQSDPHWRITKVLGELLRMKTLKTESFGSQDMSAQAIATSAMSRSERYPRSDATIFRCSSIQSVSTDSPDYVSLMRTAVYAREVPNWTESGRQDMTRDALVVDTLARPMQSPRFVVVDSLVAAEVCPLK